MPSLKCLSAETRLLAQGYPGFLRAPDGLDGRGLLVQTLAGEAGEGTWLATKILLVSFLSEIQIHFPKPLFPKFMSVPSVDTHLPTHMYIHPYSRPPPQGGDIFP